jgi:hypothetical protein
MRHLVEGLGAAGAAPTPDAGGAAAAGAAGMLSAEMEEAVEELHANIKQQVGRGFRGARGAPASGLPHPWTPGRAHAPSTAGASPDRCAPASTPTPAPPSPHHAQANLLSSLHGAAALLGLRNPILIANSFVTCYPWIPDMVKLVRGWGLGKGGGDSGVGALLLARGLDSALAPGPMASSEAAAFGRSPGAHARRPPDASARLPARPQTQVGGEICLPPIFFQAGIGLPAPDVQDGYKRMAEALAKPPLDAAAAAAAPAAPAAAAAAKQL